MLDADPLPRILLSRTNKILYKNDAARALLGEEQESDYFGHTPLAFNVPILLNDIQDALELVKVTTRVEQLGKKQTTCWTCPVVTQGKVNGVQIILALHPNS